MHGATMKIKIVNVYVYHMWLFDALCILLPLRSEVNGWEFSKHKVVVVTDK
jgi:hypothetical protein